jgi:hypothetical protein
MSIISSLDIAILSALNVLASRFGLKPSETEASLSHDGKTEESVLTFHGRPNSSEKSVRFDALMALLGCQNGELRTDDTYQMEDILDAALKKAPRTRAI